MMFTRSNPDAVIYQTNDAHSVYLPSVKGMHFASSGVAAEFFYLP